MIRSLLTLLAFITGLAAVGTPAEARVCAVGGTEVGVLENVSGSERIASREAGIQAPRARRGSVERPEACRKPGRRTVVIPTVQFGADRAFE